MLTPKQKLDNQAARKLKIIQHNQNTQNNPLFYPEETWIETDDLIQMQENQGPSWPKKKRKI